MENDDSKTKENSAASSTNKGDDLPVPESSIDITAKQRQLEVEESAEDLKDESHGYDPYEHSPVKD